MKTEISFSSLKKLCFLITSLFLFSHASGQHQFEVSGYTLDSSTGQVLKNVNITLNKVLVAKSNNLGYYMVSVPPYENELTFEHSSYLGVIKQLNINGNTILNVALQAQSTDFKTFLEPSTETNRLLETEAGKIVLPLKEFDHGSHLASEPDLFRSIHKLPGVDFGNEINAVLNVRGGSNDQNLILYNGIPVYKPTQLFNTLSFQIAPVEEATLYRGPSPAKFGGRLSSVLNIKSLDGIAKEPTAEFALSLASVKFKVATPLKLNKSSMSLSLRRSYIDLLMPGLFNDGDNAFNFYDINFKFNRLLKDNARFSFFTLFTKDNLLLSSESTDPNLGTTTYKDGVFTYNLLSGVDLEKQFRKNLFGKLSLAYSGNALRLLLSELNLKQAAGLPVLSETHFSFGNYDMIVNADLYSNRFNKHRLNYGANVVNHTYATGVLVERNEDNLGNELESETTGENTPETSTEIALYAEDEFDFSDKVNVIGGFRGVYYSKDSYSRLLLEPRIRMRFQINEKSAWRIAYSKNHQFSHFLSYANGNYFSARWVPATENAPVQSSSILTGSIVHRLKNNLIVEAEAYYKQMDDIIISKDGFIGEVLNWENLIIPGEGKSYGVELFTKGTKEHIDFMASYSLSWAKRRYSGINADQYFDYDFDRRHMLKLNFSYRRSNYDRVAVNYVLGSGRPFSLPNSKYRDIDGRIILGYDEINNYRANYYNRLDISYNRMVFRQSGVENYFNISVYNVLMNQNPSQIFSELDKSVQQGIVYRASAISYLVIIPAVSYNIKF
jgi:hypothetical protein